MSQTIRPDDLAVLHYLDEQADELRRQPGLHQRGEVITWYEQVAGVREYTAVADGYGRFDLLAYEGRNPNDRLVHHQASYDSENDAWLAAMRLGEQGVAWEDRDKPVPDEGEEDDPTDWRHAQFKYLDAFFAVFEQYRERDGRAFTVLEAITSPNADVHAECVPMFRIRFPDDGRETYAQLEEVVESVNGSPVEVFLGSPVPVRIGDNRDPRSRHP